MVIVSSPPSSDELTGLDGTWTRRFLKKAEDLRPEELEDLKTKVDLEHSGKGLQTYWEGVIHKRKKLEVKCTHILGSLSLLNEAGKYNVEDLSSEGFSNSLPIDASSTSKHTLDSTIPASFERTKKIRNDESGQGEEYKQTKRVHFHKERPKSQKKKSFSRKKTPSNDNDENEEALSPEDSLTFALNSSKIWTLPSGQNVGDIYAKKISENARAIKNKKRLTATDKAILHYGASRLIDLSTHMNKWFCDNDKKFIKKN
ncbi:hypothetical protein RhiirA4_546754 [Rhizophagus irregularis]|uniref:Uncharacterized protein n=1 Tax=Rhizophagus irregularis TaxID=588596 RepID=A0A2I1GYT9_9GLOM|nr:hypothetical protein RhiirA4_546754 [Rhizophagus irregularis]